MEIPRASQIPHHLQRLTGTVAAAMAFIAAGAPHAEAAYKPEPGTVQLPEGDLPGPETLPGHGIKVGQASRIALSRAAVKIYATYPPSPNGKYQTPARATCSGTKVRYRGHSYISTAAHCFDSDTQGSGGILTAQQYPQQGRAIDFVNRTGAATYVIQDPSQPRTSQQPLAKVTGISVSTRGSDSALLKVKPLPVAEPKSGVSPRTYSQIPSLPFTAGQKLIPGQEIAMASSPQSSNNQLIQAKGTYLGRVDLSVPVAFGERYIERPFDIVVFSPTQPKKDTCYYGASGSSAQGGVVIQTGAPTSNSLITGALSRRLNSTYDPQLQVGNNKQDLEEYTADVKTWIQEVALNLGVAIPDGATVCEYSVMTKRLRNDLLTGFGNFAPALSPPPLKGGDYGGMK